MRWRSVQLCVLVALAVGASSAAPALATPPCDETHADTASRDSGFYADATKATTFKRWSIYKVLCADLTGDGNAEMVVWLRGYYSTEGSPTPWAIFNGGSDAWQRKFARLDVNVWGLAVHGNEVIEKVPIRKPNEPGCCPSQFRYHHFHWDGSTYVQGSGPA